MNNGKPLKIEFLMVSLIRLKYTDMHMILMHFFSSSNSFLPFNIFVEMEEIVNYNAMVSVVH